MSYIYIKEPPTNGKVLIKTTLGDLDIELWSKETPLACRNFVQLCLEGYYNGTIFHRVVQDFIAQGGDPTGTGEGGESVYGHPFKDEFHSRLKFSRRGLVGMANAGPHDNSSQFFFTLGRADELTNKHTLFGKVTGDTLYNMVKFNDIPTDKEERPLDPAPRIVRTEVLVNPFDDIIPREDPRRALERKKAEKVSQSRATKNFSLLSFGEEAEEDEEETEEASKQLKIKSSHDVLKEDPRLSSQPAVDASEMGGEEEERAVERGVMGGGEGVEGAESDERWDAYMKEREKRLRLLEAEWEDEDTRKRRRKEELRKESQQLRKELRDSKKKKEKEEEEKKAEEERRQRELPEPVRALRAEQELYRKRKKALKKGGEREQQTLELLSKFKGKLLSAKMGEEEEEKEEEKEREETVDTSWLKHKLECADELLVIAKDANVQNEDTFDIYDPRNPINKRRREEGKKESRQEGRRKGRGEEHRSSRAERTRK